MPFNAQMTMSTQKIIKQCPIFLQARVLLEVKFWGAETILMTRESLGFQVNVAQSEQPQAPK